MDLRLLSCKVKYLQHKHKCVKIIWEFLVDDLMNVVFTDYRDMDDQTIDEYSTFKTRELFDIREAYDLNYFQEDEYYNEIFDAIQQYADDHAYIRYT